MFPLREWLLPLEWGFEGWIGFGWKRHKMLCSQVGIVLDGGMNIHGMFGGSKLSSLCESEDGVGGLMGDETQEGVGVSLTDFFIYQTFTQLLHHEGQ